MNLMNTSFFSERYHDKIMWKSDIMTDVKMILFCIDTESESEEQLRLSSALTSLPSWFKSSVVWLKA